MKRIYLYALATLTAALMLGALSASCDEDHKMGVYVPPPGARFGWQAPVRGVVDTNCTVTACPIVQDGLTLVAGNRVLLVAQTSAAQNGIYLVGAASDSGGTMVAPLTISSDTSTSAQLLPGAVVRSVSGTKYAGSSWALGADSTTWTELSPGTTAPDAGDTCTYGQTRITSAGADGGTLYTCTATSTWGKTTLTGL